ncbi:MAG: hypothetical protein ACOX3S_09690 [Anaerolineae bacterium]|jgi:hypothetical protein
MRTPPRAQTMGALLLLLTVALGGCSQPPEPTARATLGPPLPPTLEHTATPHVDVVLTATPSAAPTVVAPTGTAPAATAKPQPRPKEGIALTVLHSNDVNGYIDPCG